MQLSQPLQARAGLHVGEVLVWENSVDAVRLGAKPLEVEGLAKPLAGRLMALARPGQILLSATAEPLAHRAARELGERGELLVWKSYGRWRFKGIPEAQEVHEVGEPGLAPLRIPAHTPKAWRDLPLWRRPVALAAEALLVAGMAIGAWFLAQPKPAIAFAERDWVVMGDLRNLTGDPRLDESLEQAFRISLEQSRYVNVLGDLKVRDTLQRMQRKPDAAVDRALGSEIALRDGARALLLPTVAEVGGRLRVSAEVVDPHTQTTVYAVSADGKGIESALGSIDDVTDQLREKLGEAMQNVQKTSVPLPNVATPSLDALKAYAVARRMADDFRRSRAGARACTGAHCSWTRSSRWPMPTWRACMLRWVRSLRRADEWRKALALPQRLSPQERQMIELMLLQHDGPQNYFRKADEYLALYPDDYQTIGRLSSNQWHQRNDFRATEATSRRALKPQNERSRSVRYNLGIALLGQERHDAALVEFRLAREAGFLGAGEFYALVHEARGQFAEADKVYFASAVGRNGWQGETGAIVWIDRGEPARAAAAVRAWAARRPMRRAICWNRCAHSAATGQHGGAARPGRCGGCAAGTAGADRCGRNGGRCGVSRHFRPSCRLYSGLLSAYRNDRSGVEDALRHTQGSAVVRDYPTVRELHQVLEAEQERLAGQPRLAMARLEPLARQDTALVATHWALMRAAQAAGKADIASAQIEWLATHRGRVFAESTTSDVLRFFNISVSAAALRSHRRVRRRNQPHTEKCRCATRSGGVFPTSRASASIGAIKQSTPGLRCMRHSPRGECPDSPSRLTGSGVSDYPGSGCIHPALRRGIATVSLR